jgi:hypothetical protein
MMTTLQVFDKPMCCSTGVCGAEVDPVLPRFAADLAWLKSRGVAVERYNLAQQPLQFVAHANVKDAIRHGVDGVLPLVRVDGEIVSRGVYPSREELERLCGLPNPASVAAGDSCAGPT